MADFPNAIYDPRTKENKPGTVYNPANTTEAYAEDVTKLDDEVVAIETTLGENPEGDFDTVVDRLDDVDSSIASLESGKQDTLGFTPENVTNKSTDVSGDSGSNTKYPSVKAVYDWVVANFQAALGFTPENVSNKSTSVSGDSGSNTKYPSVKAVYDWALATFQSALGFTPEDVANKKTAMAGNTTSNTFYLSAKAIYDWAVATFQAALGFTPEDVANKSTNTSLGTSDTLYPSQKAVKTYVDNNLGGTPGTLRKKVTASGTGVSSVSISSLDLDTDIAYEIWLSVKLSSGGNNVLMQLNGTGSSNYEYNRSDNGGSGSPQQSQNSINLSPSPNSTTIQFFHIRIMRCVTGDMTSIFWSAATSTTSAGNNGDVGVGSGMCAITSNITSVDFSFGVTSNYQYFINKLNG